MEKYKYGGIANHKIIHKELVSKVLDIQERLKMGTSSLSIEVMKFLKDWLINHIGEQDKKYGMHINTKKK
jgi:hemerythrin-like metal-binding protein